MLAVEEARARLAEQDWPSALAHPVESLRAERVWVPYSKVTGQLEARSPGCRLTRLYRPSGVALERFRDQPPAGERILGAPTANAALVPFWVFTVEGSWDADSPVAANSRDAQHPWAAVDATLGQLVAGQLPAALVPARARLWFLVGLFLLSLSLGTSILISALKFPLRYVRIGLELREWALVFFAIFGVSLVLGYLGYKVRRLVGPALEAILGLGAGLPALLLEPVARVGRGVVEFPYDRRWFGLLKWTGVLILVCCFGQLAWVGGQVGYVSALATLLGVAGLLLGVGGAVLALWIARGGWLALAPRPLIADPEVDDEVAEPVRVSVRMALLTCAGFALGAAFSASGLGSFLFDSNTTKDSVLMMEWGARAGATLGAALAPTSPGARVTLCLGTVLEVLAFALLNAWFAPLAVFVAMLFAAVPMLRELDVERPAQAALLTAWGFSLGAALGRVGGKAIGLVLMGPVGVVLGDALGEHVGSAVGMSYAKRRVQRA